MVLIYPHLPSCLLVVVCLFALFILLAAWAVVVCQHTQETSRVVEGIYKPHWARAENSQLCLVYMERCNVADINSYVSIIVQVKYCCLSVFSRTRIVFQSTQNNYLTLLVCAYTVCSWPQHTHIVMVIQCQCDRQYSMCGYQWTRIIAIYIEFKAYPVHAW